MRTQFSATTLALLLAARMSVAGTDDLWFNPPGGTWVPSAVVVSDMKAALDRVLPASLSAQLDIAQTPARYWFQFRGRGSGTEKEIEIIGHPFPVSERAARAYLDVSTPESCTVAARYSPTVKEIRGLQVSGLSCPPRI